MAFQASSIIEEKYRVKPTFFCGRKAKTLVASLFYILSPNHPRVTRSGYYVKRLTQKLLAEKMGLSGVAIKNNYQRWLHEFPDLKQFMTRR